MMPAYTIYGVFAEHLFWRIPQRGCLLCSTSLVQALDTSLLSNFKEFVSGKTKHFNFTLQLYLTQLIQRYFSRIISNVLLANTFNECQEHTLGVLKNRYSRCSYQMRFIKKAVLRNFSKFTGNGTGVSPWISRNF